MLGSTIGEYNWKVGDRVVHRRDSSLHGKIMVVEENGLSVMVLWDTDDPGCFSDEWWLNEGKDDLDFQWSNKLVREPGPVDRPGTVVNISV